VRKVNPILYWLGVGLFLIVVVSYNYEILRPAYDGYTAENTYSHIANIHDHLEYENALINFSEQPNTVWDYFNNVAGISSFYLLLTIFLGFDNVISTSLLVNCMTLVIAAAIHQKICNTYALRGSAYTFFLNLPMIYFCQLIGKDMLYIAVLYAMLLFILRKRWMLLTILAIVSAVIRAQIVIIFLFVLIFWFWQVPFKRRLLVLYFLSAIAGAYAFTGNKVIGLDADLGSGISWIVFELNVATGMGNLLLNPIRLLQYIVEFVIAPFSLISTDIHFFNLFLVPFLVYFILHIRWLRGLAAIRSPATQFFFALILVLLIMPIINLRYFVTLFPFLVIAMLVTPQRSYRKAAGQYVSAAHSISS